MADVPEIPNEIPKSPDTEKEGNWTDDALKGVIDGAKTMKHMAAAATDAVSAILPKAGDVFKPAKPLTEAEALKLAMTPKGNDVIARAVEATPEHTKELSELLQDYAKLAAAAGIRNDMPSDPIKAAQAFDSDKGRLLKTLGDKIV